MIEIIRKGQEREASLSERNADKWGNYDNPPNGCPNCGRFRIMLGEDNKHRCEKCFWCIEDSGYDNDYI